ncbi:ATP-binding protein [Lactococcus insecticola]|uniref:AAA+ ATPase domain-containing protein n=1 Tax=Pseudolactococcus insecticola TaxID=2709158 RepID=A0A6A0B4D9_9LACT|nr:ATP-binding protein [Lactococcus insecticola]GFH40042.1 hypothetical protein Hs20B_04400 [Lactococcus insecticola]
MKIDEFYNEIDKSNFYLGMISAVFRENSYVQVENLSLLNHRKLRLEQLIPNTINYFVVIDSVQGLFIGEIYQAKVNSSDSVHDDLYMGNKESIYPEIAIDVIGILDGDKFKLAGFKTVGITDKVYIANQKLVRKYLKSIEVNDYPIMDENGKQKRDDDGKKMYQNALFNFAQLSNFESEFISLKPNTLFDRHLMTIGTTNSGKSTSALSILDKLVLSGKKVLIIDPTGEYKNAFNDTEATKITLGKNAFLSTGNVDDSFWINFFDVSSSEESGKAAVLSDAISSLRYQNSIGDKSALVKDGAKASDLLFQIDAVTSNRFDISLLIEQIKNEAVKQVQESGIYKFKRDGNLYNASIWLIQKVSYFLKLSLINDFFTMDDSKTNLFSELDSFISSTNVKSLYIDSSTISKTNSAGQTIIDLIAQYILENKNSADDSFVLFVDEVHRFIDKSSEDSALVTIAREGRKKGIFLFLTTQNPKDVPDVLLGQVGTLIIHRLTHFEELRAIQNQVQPNTLSQIRKLNQGEAILTSINLLQDIHVRFEKSGRSHDNDTPLM